MEKILAEIKKIASNKNTLTVLIVIAGVMVLYFVYSNMVTQAVTKIKVPYAKKEMTSRTSVTTENIGFVEIPKKIASNLGILSNSGTVVGKYVKYGTLIPENSFFYKDMLVDFEEAIVTEFSDMKDGYTVFNLSVSLDSTYGNSIYTGNYIDLYIKAIENNKIIFGEYIKGIKVLAVLDTAGNDVFEASSDSRTPSQMWFAVPDELNQVLLKAERITGVQIIPIPRNASYSDTERDAEISSNFINSYIQSKITTIDTSVSNGSYFGNLGE